MERDGVEEQVFESRANMCANSYRCDELAMNEGTQHHLIPYDKELITVCKDKRKSRTFCKFPRKKEEKSYSARSEKDRDETSSQVFVLVIIT